MGTIPASENEFPQLLLAEVAAPATPASGLIVVYAKSDGLLYWKDDGGTEHALDVAAHLADTIDAHDASAISVLDTAAVFTGTEVETVLKELYDAIAGGGISPTIVDAKGDIIAATAADTVDNLTVGANGSFLQALSTEATGLIWRAAPAFAVYKRTTADYTATTSTFADVDATNLALTITTLARRVLIRFVGTGQNSTASDGLWLDVDLDGARLGGDLGLTGARFAGAGHRENLSFEWMTDVLSAGSHTFKLQWRRTSAGTTTLFGTTTGNQPLQFSVEETFLTT